MAFFQGGGPQGFPPPPFDPRNAPIQILPRQQLDARSLPRDQQSLPDVSELPTFDGTNIVIPPNFKGYKLPVSKPQDGTTKEEMKEVIKECIRDEPELLSAAIAEALESRGDKSDQEKQDLGKRLDSSIRVYSQQVSKQFGNFWFELPSNTYGTAIWALLVMDIEALSLGTVLNFKSGNGEGAEDDDIPPHQKWEDNAGLWAVIYYIRKRLWPFINVLLFFIVAVGMCVATFLIQFGFAFLLNASLSLAPDFSSTDGSEYICGTTGWLQFISIGFFLAYMLGQVPKVLKAALLVWFADFETTEERGLDGKKRLYRSDEGNVNKETEHDRTKVSMIWRRFFATLVVGLDLAVTVFVTYVGVRYIFWSGYTSLDPSFLDEDPNRFGSYPYATGGFPWMSNTDGIEEVLMATLALVFIMDIDENLFEYMLPVCVQAIVKDTRLSCTKWMPTVFDEEDFKKLGQPMFTKHEEAINPNSCLSDLHPKTAQPGVPGGPTNPEQYITEFDKVKDTLAFKFGTPKRDPQGKEQEKTGYLRYTNRIVGWNEYQKLYVKCHQIPRPTDDVFLEEKQQLDAWREEQNTKERFEYSWMQLIPFLTFFWIASIIMAAACVVWFVRAARECAVFDSKPMPDMPSQVPGDQGIGLLDNDHSVSAYVLFIPVFFAAAGCCVIALRYFIFAYCLDMFRVVDEEVINVEARAAAAKNLTITSSASAPTTPAANAPPNGNAPPPTVNAGLVTAQPPFLPPNGVAPPPGFGPPGRF